MTMFGRSQTNRVVPTRKDVDVDVPAQMKNQTNRVVPTRKDVDVPTQKKTKSFVFSLGRKGNKLPPIDKKQNKDESEKSSSSKKRHGKLISFLTKPKKLWKRKGSKNSEKEKAVESETISAGPSASLVEETERNKSFKNPNGIYRGEFDTETRVRKGEGEMNYYNGNVYKGQWDGDKFSGMGDYRWDDGTRYQGNFMRGKADGKGTILWPNGESYTGGYKRNKRHGFGVFYYPDGSFYEGEWLADKKNGIGKYHWASGSTYEGDFQDGRREGRGATEFPNGSIYEGTYTDDQIYGKGKIYAESTSYEIDRRKSKSIGAGGYLLISEEEMQVSTRQIQKEDSFSVLLDVLPRTGYSKKFKQQDVIVCVLSLLLLCLYFYVG